MFLFPTRFFFELAWHPETSRFLGGVRLAPTAGTQGCRWGTMASSEIPQIAQREGPREKLCRLVTLATLLATRDHLKHCVDAEEGRALSWPAG